MAYLDSEIAPTPRSKSGTTKIEKFGWTLKDLPGTFMMVDKRQLHVDHATYQRDEQQRRAIALAREWSWVACGCLTVARRPDGTFAIIDGQHRRAAAMKRSDIVALPCLIFEITEIVEEAAGFLRANTMRRAVTSIEKFRAQLAVGDRAASVVQALCREHGFRVEPHAGPKNVRCVGLLTRLAASNEALFRQAWPLIVDAHHGESINERIVAALFYLFRVTDGRIAKEPFYSRLLRMGRPALNDAIAKANSYYARGGEKVWASGIAETLNRGLRNNRISISLGDRDLVDASAP